MRGKCCLRFCCSPAGLCPSSCPVPDRPKMLNCKDARASLFISISPMIWVLIVGAVKSELASKSDPKVNGINGGGIFEQSGLVFTGDRSVIDRKRPLKSYRQCFHALTWTPSHLQGAKATTSHNSRCLRPMTASVGPCGRGRVSSTSPLNLDDTCDCFGQIKGGMG